MVKPRGEITFYKYANNPDRCWIRLDLTCSCGRFYVQDDDEPTSIDELTSTDTKAHDVLIPGLTRCLRRLGLLHAPDPVN